MLFHRDYYLFIGSTYNGSLDPDLDYDAFKKNALLPPNFTEEEFCDILTEIYPNYLKQIAHIARDVFQDFGITSTFSKYGVELQEYDFITPQYYNYSNDQLHIKALINDKVLLPAIEGELKQYIENYIKHIRIPTQSGYWSFEPESIEELKTQITSPQDLDRPFPTLFYSICGQLKIDLWDLRRTIAERAQEEIDELMGEKIVFLNRLSNK